MCAIPARSLLRLSGSAVCLRLPAAAVQTVPSGSGSGSRRFPARRGRAVPRGLIASALAQPAKPPAQRLLCWQSCALAGIADPAREMGRDAASSSRDGARTFCTLGKVCYLVRWRVETYLSVAVIKWQKRCGTCGVVGLPGAAESHPCQSHTLATAPDPVYRGRGCGMPGRSVVALGSCPSGKDTARWHGGEMEQSQP